MDHKFRISPFSIIPKVEEMWEVQEKDMNYEVGTGQSLTLESKMMTMMLIYPLHVKQRHKLT